MEIGPMEKIFEIYIRRTPERLWAAITDHDAWGKFQFGNAITSDFTPGSHVEITNPKAGIVLARTSTAAGRWSSRASRPGSRRARC